MHYISWFVSIVCVYGRVRTCCVFVCVCAYVYVCASVHACVCVCVCVRTRTCIFAITQCVSLSVFFFHTTSNFNTIILYNDWVILANAGLFWCFHNLLNSDMGSIICWTLTWATGSLTCVCDLIVHMHNIYIYIYIYICTWGALVYGLIWNICASVCALLHHLKTSYTDNKQPQNNIQSLWFSSS